jgi:hypothetical protein
MLKDTRSTTLNKSVWDVISVSILPESEERHGPGSSALKWQKPALVQSADRWSPEGRSDSVPLSDLSPVPLAYSVIGRVTLPTFPVPVQELDEVIRAREADLAAGGSCSRLDIGIQEGLPVRRRQWPERPREVYRWGAQAVPTKDDHVGVAPASAVVGTIGNSSERCSLAVASAQSLPPSSIPFAAAKGSTPITTEPFNRSIASCSTLRQAQSQTAASRVPYRSAG